MREWGDYPQRSQDGPPRTSDVRVCIFKGLQVSQTALRTKDVSQLAQTSRTNLKSEIVLADILIFNLVSAPRYCHTFESALGT